MKKAIVLILLLCFAVSYFAACETSEIGSDASAESNDSGSNVSKSENSKSDKGEYSEYINADGNYVPKHEVKDLNGRTFTIIVRGEIAGTYQSEDFTTNSTLYGDLLNDAVQKRNDAVENIYNVVLDVVKSDTINNDILLDCKSNLGSYDAIMPTLKSLSSLASQEYLYDLKSLESFDPNAPWYDKNCSDAFSISDQLYFTTGDITILNKVNSPSILFNKEMAKKYFPETDFYQLARDKQWTFDKLVECAKTVADISAADGGYSDDNQYGMVSSYSDPFNFYGASGELICGKDSDNLPVLQLGKTERSINLSKRLLEEFANANWLLYAEECEKPIWETSFAVFYEGRALFRPSGFSATTKLRKLSEIEFGVLPMPLMDDTQEKYNSYCTTGETAGIAIPVCAPDPEFSAYMIESYSAWAKNTITVAYYEVNLRYKDLRDDESEEMLDIIFDNIVYDIGECYNFGEYVTMFYNLTKERKSDVASGIATNKEKAENQIKQLIETYA